MYILCLALCKTVACNRLPIMWSGSLLIQAARLRSKNPTSDVTCTKKEPHPNFTISSIGYQSTLNAIMSFNHIGTEADQRMGNLSDRVATGLLEDVQRHQIRSSEVRLPMGFIWSRSLSLSIFHSFVKNPFPLSLFYLSLSRSSQAHHLPLSTQRPDLWSLVWINPFELLLFMLDI